MVLLPRRANRRFFPEAIAALKHHGVPVAGIDRMQLLEELAAQDLAVIGDFVLLPRDDLTLATVLKGPLFGLDDDALFDLAHERRGSLWGMLGTKCGDPRFSHCREMLESLLARADFTSPFEFFADLLARGGLRARILERLGDEANDPVDEFLAGGAGVRGPSSAQPAGFPPLAQERQCGGEAVPRPGRARRGPDRHHSRRQGVGGARRHPSGYGRYRESQDNPPRSGRRGKGHPPHALAAVDGAGPAGPGLEGRQGAARHRCQGRVSATALRSP